MSMLVVATVAVSAALAWLLVREFARLERERRMREAVYPIRKGYLQLTITIQDQFTPVMRRAARELNRLVSAYTKGPLMREANQYRKGGVPGGRVVDARDYEGGER